MARFTKISFPHPVRYWKVDVDTLSIIPLTAHAETERSLWVEIPKTIPVRLKIVNKQTTNVYSSWEAAQQGLIHHLDQKLRFHERQTDMHVAASREMRRLIKTAQDLKQAPQLALVPTPTFT